MRIYKTKLYTVTKYANKKVTHYGVVSGEYVRLIIGTARYAPAYNMFFNKTASIAFTVEPYELY